jgi:hypothetical protein
MSAIVYRVGSDNWPHDADDVERGKFWIKIRKSWLICVCIYWILYSREKKEKHNFSGLRRVCSRERERDSRRMHTMSRVARVSESDCAERESSRVRV